MKAPILLGVIAGAGNTDVKNLEFKHLGLDSGWLNYARSKTASHDEYHCGGECATPPRPLRHLLQCVASHQVGNRPGHFETTKSKTKNPILQLHERTKETIEKRYDQRS